MPPPLAERFEAWLEEGREGRKKKEERED